MQRLCMMRYQGLSEVQRGTCAAWTWVRTFSGSEKHAGFVELRDYGLLPKDNATFMNLVEETAGVRKEVLPVLGMFKCDIGGSLSRFIHLYHYDDFSQRDEVRARAAQDDRWKQYLSMAKPLMQTQENAIFIPATEVMEAAGSHSIQQYLNVSSSKSNAGMVELRMYQLHPGYDTIPSIVKEFSQGMPHKIAASPEAKLLFFGYTDVGMLNNVIEVWRYDSAQACMKSRQQARKVQPWRECIAKVTPRVQNFRSLFLYPVSGSPIC